MHLDGESIRWLSATIRDAYSAASFNELHSVVVPELHRRFSSIFSTCESANEDGSQHSTHRLHGNVRLPPNVVQHIWDNPNLLRTFSGRRETVLHLRQTVARGAYEHTEFYNAVARQNTLNDQIHTIVWAGGRATTFALLRDRLFTAEERLLLELFHAHFAAVVRRVGVAAEPAADAFAFPWISLTPQWRPVGLLPSQEMLLRAYFPGWRPGTSPLPAAVMAWLKESARIWARLGADSRPLVALRVGGAQGELTLRLFPNCGSRGDVLRLFERRPVPVPHGAMPLSGREQQVLHWLAEGKRDAEIAVILGIAPKTVSKHVENVLRKLRVETRTAAVALK